MVPVGSRAPPLHTVDSPTRKNGSLTRRRGARSGHRSRSSSRHRSPSDDSEGEPEHKPYAPAAALEAELRASCGSSSAGVDRGLGRVASSLRSSWSISSAIMPPMPNGEAVPTLLSHLAGAFWVLRCWSLWKPSPIWLSFCVAPPCALGAGRCFREGYIYTELGEHHACSCGQAH